MGKGSLPSMAGISSANTFDIWNKVLLHGSLYSFLSLFLFLFFFFLGKNQASKQAKVYFIK
jgi:hypothetical protein